jgi:Bacteriophage Sf6, terminase small subunit-like
MPRSGFRLNPAVFSDPQVIPQLVPPRGRGRPTLYSPELIEEFCGLIVEGMTIDRACKEVGMPSKRTIKYWLTKYPEFRREYEAAVIFRNQCWMDDCVDIADSHKEGETTSDRKLRIEIRLSQLNGMGLKAVSRPGVCGAGVSELKK